MASETDDAVSERIFDFANCEKVESVTRDKRTRFSTGQNSSGYSSADLSDYCDGTHGTNDSEFGTAGIAELRHAGNKNDYDSSIAWHANVDTNSSSSSDSDSSEDDKDEDDDYRVERREQRVLRSQRSQQPRLFSPVSTLCEENRFVPSKVLDNDAEGDSAEERAEENAEAECAVDADGPANAERSTSGYEIVVRFFTYYLICIE